MATGKGSNQRTRIESDVTPQQLDGIGIAYHQSSDIAADACAIIDSAQVAARRTINTMLVARNWLLGRRIAEEELRGKDRADYGKEVVRDLAKKLTERYGRGFSKRELYWYLQFYKLFPEIVYSVSSRSRSVLSWTHYRELLYVRMFDDFYRRDDDNPTLGIVLCSDTDADIARYSVLSGSEQLFASRYKLYLPTDEELRAEIETQKALFEQQAGNGNNAPGSGQTPTEHDPSA